MPDPMTSRQRIHAALHFQPLDRMPVIEWAGWWTKTIDRWVADGLPKDLTERYTLMQHFGLDLHMQDWFRAFSPGVKRPPEGLPMVQSMDDYHALRPHLYPDVFADPNKRELWQHRAKLQAAGDAALWYTLDGFFWFPRMLLGIEPHMIAFYDQPELMHTINNDLADWHLRTIEQIHDFCQPDWMTFAEDMSYNNGPMLSESLFDEFMLPYYNRVIPAIKQADTVVIVDSDGDITLAAPWFEKAGIEGVLPLERQAGVDINTLRANHPTMRFIGHYDKMVMTRGESAMREEFERLLPAARTGGFIISCDHQTPPGVSLHEYQIYVKLLHEYANKAATGGRAPTPRRSDLS